MATPKSPHRKSIPIGAVFGRLTVVAEGQRFMNGKYNGEAGWICQCSCGNQKLIRQGCLKAGQTRSCGCLYRETRGINRLAVGEAAFSTLYYSYKTRATRHLMAFDLSKDAFRALVTSDCFYCGRPPEQRRVYREINGAFVYNGIDRQNNDEGYVHGNCVPCCKGCNTMKRDMDLDEFLSYIERIHERCKAYSRRV